MPPAAMWSSVTTTISSNGSCREARQRARSSLRSVAWGNLGAGPKPPRRSSKAWARAASAVSSGASFNSADLSPSEALGLEELHRLFGLLEDVVAAIAPGGGHGREHVAEAQHSAPAARRPVGAAEERLLLGREEDRHRPAALAGHGLHGLHVDLVQVGPLFAIDLDADEIAVQEFRDRRVLETLVGHHVAPVAGRIADREEDRLLLRAGTLQRLRAPGMPIDGVLGVLQQVRADFLTELVHAEFYGPVRDGDTSCGIRARIPRLGHLGDFTILPRKTNELPSRP